MNDFVGEVEYVKYSELEKDIRKFNDYEVFGKDSSNEYNLYLIHLGDKNKPKILITSNVHGVEWHTASYSLKGMKMLDDKTHPYKDMMNKLLTNFHVLYVPVLNPWGYDNVNDIYAQFENIHYKNYNNVDINRDFEDVTQMETKNMINVMKKYKPFAHMDLHTFQSEYQLANQNIVIGNERDDTVIYQNRLSNMMEEYTKQKVHQWKKQPLRDKMVRGYTANQVNPYTGVTLSLLSELVKPTRISGEIKRKLSEAQIYDFGNYFLSAFFELAMDYYDENKIPDNPDDPDGSGEYVYKIEMEHKIVHLTRNGQKLVTKVLEEYDETCNNMKIETTINRNSEGIAVTIDRKEIK